jgi:hypothetical protein
MVRFYPSDGLLRHIAALLAEDIKLELIKCTDHGSGLMCGLTSL